MKSKNSCCTCFRIVGRFDPDAVTALLGLTPERTWRIGDKRRNGTPRDDAGWEIGRCREYDPIVANQMEMTASILYDKIDLLNRIRKENDVRFYLAVVPEIRVGEVNPCLSPSLDIIDFCHETRTEIDIDLYVCGDDEP